MSSIVLVRHGQPHVDWSPLLSYSQFRSWTKNYDLVSLVDDDFPDEDVRNLVADTSAVFCSSLRRSQQSHQRSGCPREFVEDRIFNEVSLTVPYIPFMHLRPAYWVLLSMKILQLGFGRKAVKRRANQAVDLLVQTAERHQGSTLLFGHGTMITYIDQELLSRRWQRKRQSAAPNAYWGWRIYSL